MQGSTYTTRTKQCYDEDGSPDARSCPKRRAGHTRWGAVCNTHKLATGRWAQRRKQGFASKKEAEEWLADVIGDVRAGRILSTAQRKITVGEWCDEWLAGKVNLRPSSVRSYRLVIRDYIKPSLGRVPLAELTPGHLDAFLARMRDGRLRPAHNRRKPDGQLSTKTINHTFGILRTALGAAVKRRLLTWNPCSAVELQSAEHHEAQVWSPAEAETFLSYAEGHEPRMAIGYRLALRFGLRRGELAALRWDDIEGGYLTVRRNAVSVGGEVVIGEPKSAKGVRAIPLAADPGMDAALRAARRRQLQDRMAAGPDWQETGLVVAGEHGAMIPPWLLSEQFRKLAQAAGLRVITLHEGRHTAGTIWYEATRDLKKVQRWMGHATAAITSDLYVHDRDATDEDAASAVAAYWNTHASPQRVLAD